MSDSEYKGSFLEAMGVSESNPRMAELQSIRAELAAEKQAHAETAAKLEEARRKAESYRDDKWDGDGKGSERDPLPWEPTPVGGETT